jgi:uncharacterized protein YggU (UPF0235/DUF167 family)
LRGVSFQRVWYVPIFMLRLTVHAHPNARSQRIELLDDDELGVWVRARAVEGQANVAIERAVATTLDLHPRQVRLTAGHTSRRKIVEIDLPDLAALRARLVAHAMRSG